MRRIYQPKNGDYENLQLFTTSLTEQIDLTLLNDDLFFFISLPEQGLALVYLRTLHWRFEGLVVNGTSYQNTGLVLETTGMGECGSKGTEYVSARIYLPLDHSPEQCVIDGDTVLDFIASRGLACDRGCIFAIKAEELRPQNLDKYFIGSNLGRWLNDMSVAGDVYFDLHNMILSDDTWRCVCCHAFVCLTVHFTPVPAFVWETSQAKRMELGWNREAGKQMDHAIENALSGLQKRQQPLDSVHLGAEFVWNTNEETLPLLNALRAAKRWRLNYVSTTQKAWESFWLSPILAKNQTVTSLWFMADLEFVESNTLDENGDIGQLQLEPIHQCLERNYFIDQIVLANNALWLLPYYMDNIAPLLSRNRRHENRLDPTENRLWLLHERLLQVYTSPQKLFKLLKDYPRALCPRLISECISDMEQWKAEQQQRQMQLQAQNASLRHDVARLHAHATNQQQQINDLRQMFFQARLR